MTASLKENCPTCKGAGTVPHVKRVMENNLPDPADFKTHDLCEKCQGTGKTDTNLKAIQEKKPGAIVDHFGNDGA